MLNDMPSDVPLSPVETNTAALGWPSETLEQRVQRLEYAVASLQDTHALEERISERVSRRLQSPPAAPEVSRLEQITAAAPPPPLVHNPLPSAPLPPPPVQQAGWLVFDVIGELWSILRVLFDLGYHLAWATRIIVMIALVLIVFSDYWVPFSSVPLLGRLLTKTVDLVLAFCIYRTLAREAQRYRQLRAEGRL
jgi:hypothetical protein